MARLTELEDLDNLTNEFLLATERKTKVPIWIIRKILRAAARLLSRSAVLGRVPSTPIGYCGILILPDLYPVEGRPIRSGAFPDHYIIPYLFDEDMIQWGYDFIPSIPMKRALSKALRKEKTYNLILKKNENNAYRYHYRRCHRTI